MRRFLAILGLFLLLISCGLETVETLPPPNVSYLDTTMVTDRTLSVVYSKNSGGADLQGYQVYYKIYPGKTNSFARLVADRDSVNLSPTVNQLVNLGYYQMSQGASAYMLGGAAASSAVSPLTPLLIATSDQTKVTLDFTNYESGSITDPVLELNGSVSGVSNPYLYRSALLFSGNVLESFTTLQQTNQNTAQQSDMAGIDTTSGSRQYEINVFVVAYGLSSTLQALYSKPVPWGVIR